MGKQSRQLSDAEKAILGTEAVAQLDTEEQINETTAETVAEGTEQTTGVSEGQEQAAQETPAGESAAIEPEVTQAPAAELQGTEGTGSDVPTMTAEDIAQQASLTASLQAADEVTPAPIPPVPSPIVNAAPAVVAEPKVAAPVQEAPKSPLGEFANLGTIGRRVMSILTTYADQMAPRKPVTDAKIVEQQRLLYEALTKTINDSGDDFEALMKFVLAFFEQHKAGVFHDIRIFRGMDNLPLSTEDRAAFQRLVNLFKLVANPQSRGIALKQVDLVASLQYGVTENGRNRVMGFFHN